MATEDASTAPIIENPQPQIALNFDTLAAVIPWIKKRKDLLSFISTSADLYSAGIPVLLGFPYGLSSSNLSSLHHFLTSKGPQSSLGLRELHLSFVSYSEDTTMDADAIAQLTDILSRAKNLQNLSIYGDVLHLYPALYEILASYSSLHSLDLLWAQGADHQTLNLLKQLQAPLTYLLFEGSEGDLHVTSALANFSNTLEDLTISTYTLCHSPVAGPVYPKLAHLRLTTVYNPQLSILVPAFPNLQTLSISINYSQHIAEQLEGWRESNLQFQADHPSQRWFLTYLAGEGGGLYTLALQTGVPDVEVFNFAPELDIEDLRVSLAPLRPMQLKIDNDDDPISGADWISTAISTGWTELTRLELSFALAEIDDLSPSYEEGLVSFFKSLRRPSELTAGPPGPPFCRACPRRDVKTFPDIAQRQDCRRCF